MIEKTKQKNNRKKKKEYKIKQRKENWSRDTCGVWEWSLSVCVCMCVWDRKKAKEKLNIRVNLISWRKTNYAVYLIIMCRERHLILRRSFPTANTKKIESDILQMWLLKEIHQTNLFRIIKFFIWVKNQNRKIRPRWMK
jgi:hypothetical protein